MKLLAALACCCGLAYAAPLGQFTDHADIGNPKITGSASYQSGQYNLAAGGENMFNSHDEFHFVWLKMSGDFTIQAHVKFTGPGATPHRKAGLMARSSLADNATYVDAAVHGNGPTAMQTRDETGGKTAMLMTTPAASAVNAVQDGSYFVELQRHGNDFVVFEQKPGGPFTVRETTSAALGNTVYLGLYLCAHNPAVKETASFSDVRIFGKKER